MKILVTGAGGFIGRGVTQALAESGHEVWALDNNSRGDLASLQTHANIRPVVCDVLDAGRVFELTRGADAIYHLAYINGTKFFYSMPAKILEVGIIGTHNVLKAALTNRVPRFYLASSSEVYQMADAIPTPEHVECRVPDVTNPRYSYGGGKIACELLTINYLRDTGTQRVIFRPHNVYGPAMGFEHVLPDLIRKVHAAHAGSGAQSIDIEIQGTGDDTRSFIFIDDAVRAILQCTLHTPDDGIYHVGTMDELTIRNVVAVIGTVAGLRIQVRASARPIGATPRRCPDTAKLQTLGFAPQISFEEGVRRTVAWYWEHYQTAGQRAVTA